MFYTLKLAKRVSELEEEMLKLTRIVQARDMDWQDMRARCKRLLDRTEKAAIRAEPVVESPDSTANGEETAAAPPSNGGGHSLSPSQLRLQQQILKMRRTP